MASSQSITFYDIASAPPQQTFAANPWKTRLALNFKGIPYQTKCVEMPDITSVREELGVPANRTLPDGTPYHTLPVIVDHGTGKKLGDSFEIAQYLDEAYPSADSTLIRQYTTGLTAAFNAHIDGIFTKYAILCSKMPFDPSVADKVKEIFASRAGAMAVDLQIDDAKLEGMMVAFEASLGELAKAYRHTGGTTDYFWRQGGTDEKQKQRGREQVGPWLDGDTPCYSDFIVGAWLKMFEASMTKQNWERVRGWQGGLWGRIVDGLGKWSEMK